jgi:hypothetical protein
MIAKMQQRVVERAAFAFRNADRDKGAGARSLLDQPDGLRHASVAIQEWRCRMHCRGFNFGNLSPAMFSPSYVERV